MFGVKVKAALAVAGALAIMAYTTVIWVKATDVANDAWKVKQATAVELARQEDKARNARTINALRAAVDQEQQARRGAEAETEELRNAIASDASDTTIRVGPELERLLDGLFDIRPNGTS